MSNRLQIQLTNFSSLSPRNKYKSNQGQRLQNNESNSKMLKTQLFKSNIKSNEKNYNSNNIYNQIENNQNLNTKNRKGLIDNKLDQQKVQQEQSKQKQKQRFYKNKKKNKYNKKDQSALESNVAYPQATIRQYLNQRRTMQNKPCQFIFCLYMIFMLMFLGIGFFYGHPDSIGVIVVIDSVNKTITCASYSNQQMNGCTGVCPDYHLYIQKLCISQNTSYYREFSTNLDKQITMYTISQSFIPIIYGTFSSLVFTSICFVILICFAQAIYFYIGVTFVMLLGFSFFLLKNVKSQLDNPDIPAVIGEGSIFQSDIMKILPLAYILMALYLIIFPFVIFSPFKISTAIKIITKMKKYFIRMSSVNMFTFLIVYVAWGLIMLQIYLILSIFTTGEQQAQANSFLYVYNSVKLSHPAVLTIHFFGIYWLFATLISWHKCFISSALCLWYFEQSVNLYPVTRGLKRSWHSLGTAAFDALLIPIEWLSLILYTVCKFTKEQQQKIDNNNQTDHTIPFSGCTYKIRGCLNTFYCKINPYSFASAPLTNYPLQASCQISAVTFAYHNHKFYNLGGTITILLSLFNCLIFLIVNYIILYTQVYVSDNNQPPRISSLALPMLIVFFLSIILGAMQANMYTAALDTLIFCFLLQKKSNVQNTKNDVKDILQNIWHDDQGDKDQLVDIFQYQDQ